MQSVIQEPVKKERRKSTRSVCAVPSSVSSASLGISPCKARVRNITVDGVQAALEQEVEADKPLTIELFNASRRCWHRKIMHVIYSDSQQDGTWRIGGSFSCPFSEEELQELLEQPGNGSTGQVG